MQVALAARNFGKLPSELLEIDEAVTALDFDLACSYRLQVYDNEREYDRFKALGVMLGGKSEDEGGEIQPDEHTKDW